MRIQQTDAILKDAQLARKHVAHETANRSVWSRAWKAITNLFHHS